MQPAAGPLEEEGLRLLPVAELAPAASGGAYDIDAGDFALEPRSVEWQRWARMWNTIVRSLRARDLLSNAERDELLFFSLREPEHAVRAALALTLTLTLTLTLALTLTLPLPLPLLLRPGRGRRAARGG